VNALADQRVTDYVNDNFVSSYLKVGTFQIIGGQKVGGNVASYFCLADGSVVHAVPGKVDANKLLSEARFAYELRKGALTAGAVLGTEKIDMRRYSDYIQKAHKDRYFAEAHGQWGHGGGKQTLPAQMPRNGNVSQQAQVHWILAKTPLPQLDRMYPIVWEQVLNEKLSALPVAQR
jgi:hypothetical protein